MGETNLLGLEKLPDGDFVLPIVEGRNEGLFMARYVFPSGGTSTVFGVTEEEGHAHIERCRENNKKFWQEKIDWKNNGDRTESHSRRDCIRVDGRHYVPASFGISRDGKVHGYGGAIFKWRWLDEDESVVHVSNNVFTQGEIPEQYREQLPDNAVWVEE